ncbi:hypothetical protein [Yoonia sp. I 8.24]|uniref:hypothetical protein n=1 Tax=Yoonia sp. I 8.24 TaxID=1537229 RepID=UPI001EDF37D8|nr:hypothetical protein [Yoonia sp. I 8.24]MCG3267381.1 hypothetical protein [Yoonia sp. I 8.24]
MKKAEELLLHIGQEKTGTTSLQWALKQKAHVLRERGILLPDMPPETGNAVLLAHSLFGHTEVSKGREIWLKMDRTEILRAADRAWQDILETVASDTPKSILISSEVLFRPMSKAVITSANQQIDQVAETSRIIAYLRAPDSHYLSNLQQALKGLSTASQPSRTSARDTLLPLIKNWNGPVSLNVFDRKTLNGGDIISDFVKKYLPALDPAEINHRNFEINTTHSTEAMAILHDLTTHTLEWRFDPRALAVEVFKADRRLEQPTPPKLRDATNAALLNWRAPDLFWMRDTQGITFPGIDYGAIDENDFDGAHLEFDRIETICTVNPARKAELFRRAARRARLPQKLRQLLYKY